MLALSSAALALEYWVADLALAQVNCTDMAPALSTAVAADQLAHEENVEVAAAWGTTLTAQYPFEQAEGRVQNLADSGKGHL